MSAALIMSCASMEKETDEKKEIEEVISPCLGSPCMG